AAAQTGSGDDTTRGSPASLTPHWESGRGQNQKRTNQNHQNHNQLKNEKPELSLMTAPPAGSLCNTVTLLLLLLIKQERP
uniref:Uncharacterized protein n=1 Tax=Poecilia formosa TaxID=48698 RepID=A0A096MCD1_POEFO